MLKLREETTSLLVAALDGTHVHLENKHLSRGFYWVLWIMYAFVYMTKSCFTAAMASMIAEGIITKTQSGTITAVFYLVYGPLQILGGFMADKYNPYRMIKWSLVGGAVSNALIFLHPEYSVMLTAWTFNAIAQFALWPCAFKIISSHLVRSDRKMNTFYISFGTTAGMFLSYLVAAVVPNWKYNFLISAVVLAVFAVIIYVMYKKVVLPRMKPDYDVHVSENGKIEFEETQKEKTPAMGLFIKSGFFIMCVLVFCRVVIDNGIKTLSPVMLMESYEISPSLSNALGLIVIVAGLLGMLLVGFIYPRFVRNELWVHVGMLAFALPFTVALKNMVHIGALGTVVSMCIISALFTAMRTLAYNYNLRFVKYGKSGTAAGISNAAESLAVMAQSYGFTYIADKSGWNPVMSICVITVIAAIVLNIGVIYSWSMFKKTEKAKE